MCASGPNPSFMGYSNGFPNFLPITVSLSSAVIYHKVWNLFFCQKQVCALVMWQQSVLYHSEDYQPDLYMISPFRSPCTHPHRSWLVLERGVTYSSPPPPWSNFTFGCSLYCCCLLSINSSKKSNWGNSFFCVRRKLPFLCFAPFSTPLYHFLVSLFVQCRRFSCLVKWSRHAWIQASGVRLWRCGQVCSGEYSHLIPLSLRHLNYDYYWALCWAGTDNLQLTAKMQVAQKTCIKWM